MAKAGDADITSDFLAPPNATIDGNFFTYTGMRILNNATPPTSFKKPALAISAFGSASAGTVSLPGTLFVTNIDDNILAKSFRTDIKTIQALKARLLFPPNP
ncbi:hypothetical protein HS088_TW02G00729 [Tripterygium wilfordii]|uniref:Uncharacterized protein n=1 Tax=Tripterygium wilfordii TaxID=458696 RepID=A0A7J7DZ83_TRIWF|nr:hypothetical protein HS088_TW02G00729 [Tripterygium wilfordii]